MGSVFTSQSKDLAAMSDEALVQWAKAGKDDAFEELMRRSWDQSLGLALFRHAVEEPRTPLAQHAVVGWVAHGWAFSRAAHQSARLSIGRSWPTSFEA